MNKVKALKRVAKILNKDVIDVSKVVFENIVFCLCILYIMITVISAGIWLSVGVSSVWATIWEPWAISFAPYWTVGNLILAFLVWIGHHAYQAINNQK